MGKNSMLSGEIQGRKTWSSSKPVVIATLSGESVIFNIYAFLSLSFLMWAFAYISAMCVFLKGADEINKCGSIPQPVYKWPSIVFLYSKKSLRLSIILRNSSLSTGEEEHKDVTYRAAPVLLFAARSLQYINILDIRPSCSIG